MDQIETGPGLPQAAMVPRRSGPAKTRCSSKTAGREECARQSPDARPLCYLENMAIGTLSDDGWDGGRRPPLVGCGFSGEDGGSRRRLKNKDRPAVRSRKNLATLARVYLRTVLTEAQRVVWPRPAEVGRCSVDMVLGLAILLLLVWALGSVF